MVSIWLGIHSLTTISISPVLGLQVDVIMAIIPLPIHVCAHVVHFYGWCCKSSSIILLPCSSRHGLSIKTRAHRKSWYHHSLLWWLHSKNGIIGRLLHPPCILIEFWGSELESSCLCGKYFNHWVIFYAQGSIFLLNLVLGDQSQVCMPIRQVLHWATSPTPKEEQFE